MLQVKRESQITFLQSEALGRVPRIVHAFSTRRGERNDFTLGAGATSNPLVQLNRVRFVASAGAVGWPVLKLKQIHSGIVRTMEDTSAAGEAAEGDAAITSLSGVLLSVQTADCVPILLADSETRAIAAVHAGWRGTSARIVETTVAELGRRHSVDPTKIVAAIGPHIGVCCYEVGEEVVEAMDDPAVIERRTEWPKPHLNLAEANRRQLLKAGIPETQVEISSLCTRCREDLFFSYRRDGARTGHMLSIIGIAP
jgi:purine-nucleoside/S-methyl-5'-thioadenosine phosphorylase / adenosine deaminase